MSDVFIGCIRETLFSSEAAGEFWAFNLTCKNFSYVIGMGMGMGELKFFEVSSLLHRLTFMDETIFVEIFYTRERQCLMKCSGQSGLGMQTVYTFHFSILIKHC